MNLPEKYVLDRFLNFKHIGNKKLFFSENNIFFVIFNGESYDYIGSQRFVYDIINKKFPMEKNDDIKNQVPQLTMKDIKLIVELGQISKGRELFMHHLGNKNSDNKVNIFKV